MPANCQQCGTPVPTQDGQDALCPACLWNMAMRTPSEPHDSGDVTIISSPQFPAVEGHTILQELARGGMGIVFKARQHEPAREVALKMLLPVDEHREDVRERFRVEISALAGLDHPRILPLYQSGTTSDGRPWFTMKLATGGTLAGRLQRRKPFAPRDAAALMATMADAVHHAHSHGFLHRDIKPANILYDESGDAYLADFGLAKILDSTADITRTHAALGTLCYMAPEVAATGTKPATTAVDIYGLGAVLYELLSGRPPFLKEGQAALLKMIVEDPPVRPSTITHIPRDLDIVCMACLEKDPGLRYFTAKDLADDLRRYLRGEPVAARRAGPTARLIAWARRKPALAALSAALTLSLTGGATWLAIAYTQLHRAQAEEATARTEGDAVNEFLIGAFADKLQNMGRLSLIEEACAEAYKRDRPRDDAGHKRRARLLLRWASANWARGDAAAATPRLREAVALMDALHTRAPKDPTAFTLSIEARCRLAEVLADTTSFSEALTQLDTADTALARPGILPLEEALRLQAEVDRIRAQLWNRLKPGTSEATAAADVAATSYRAWHARLPGDRLRTRTLSAALREAGKASYSRSETRKSPDDMEKALALFTEAVGLMRALPDRTPDEQFELAYNAGWMGDCLLLLPGKGPAAAAPLHQEEFATATALTRQDPLNGRWQFRLANSHLSRARQASTAGDAARSATLRQEQLDTLRSLHRRAPDVREWTLAWLEAEGRHGRELLKSGHSEEGRTVLDNVHAECLALVRKQPASRTSQLGWRSANFDIAEAWLALDPPHLDEAIAVYQKAIAAGEQEVAAGLAPDWWLWTNGQLLRRLADTREARSKQTGSGSLEPVREANLRAHEARSGLFRRGFVMAVSDPDGVASGFKHAGTIHARMKNYSAALAVGEDALACIAQHHTAAGPPLPWAKALRDITTACLEGPEAVKARQLAARAAEAFYPPFSRASLPPADRAVLEALQKTATPLPAP